MSFFSAVEVIIWALFSKSGRPFKRANVRTRAAYTQYSKTHRSVTELGPNLSKEEEGSIPHKSPPERLCSVNRNNGKTCSPNLSSRQWLRPPPAFSRYAKRIPRYRSRVTTSLIVPLSLMRITRTSTGQLGNLFWSAPFSLSLSPH